MDESDVKVVEREELAMVFDKAADIITKKGLAKSVFVDSEGRVCMLQAIWEGLGYEGYYGMCVDCDKEKVMRATLESDKFLGMSTVAYNDHVCYSLLDAVTALRNIADGIRSTPIKSPFA